MPFIRALPTWLAWNNGNFTSPTGITDVNTGQPIAAGGLNAGDYFDCSNQEAQAASYTTNGLLFAGRYRFVLVDSSATAANIKTGTIGYLRNGSSISGVVVTAVGSGQTAGTYTINANTGVGGGTGAQIQVVVGAGGTITSATVLSGGNGYSSDPTFTVAAGGTPGTVAAQLNSTPNVVTSYDQIAGGTAASTIRPIVFLNAITPGNYGFVQELGLATVLGASGVSAGAVGDWIDSTTGGLATNRAATNSPIGATIGRAVDVSQPSLLFKVYLTAVPVCQD